MWKCCQEQMHFKIGWLENAIPRWKHLSEMSCQWLREECLGQMEKPVQRS